MQNKTLLQGFEWYLPADQLHFKRIASLADEFAALGITAVWLPPAYKGTGGRYDVGYGVYDTYDLGEFDQKGSVATKYGTKEDYLTAVKALHQNGIEVIADIVLNHRLGADGQELIEATQDDANNRTQNISDRRMIQAWTSFTFPARQGKYSDFKWNWSHFDGTDWDDDYKYSGIFRFVGKSWDQETDQEKGNYDYLMGADLDLSNPEVVTELDRWGRWYYDTVGMDGFRLDAIKHMDFSFFTHWLKHMREYAKKEMFAVGEYWAFDVERLLHYQRASNACMHLFDVPLHYRFLQAATSNAQFDMARIFDNTWVQAEPDYAVTFVDNHDTQPSQSLSSWIPDWFKPLAYALILLTDQGIPCVFYGDMYGIPHDRIKPVAQLETMLRLRKECAYGPQHNYFDDSNVIGWTREGDLVHPLSGMAVILSDSLGGSKAMVVGKHFAGQWFYDALFNQSDPILIDNQGIGQFTVAGGSVSVWVPQTSYQHLTVEI